jgi:hypothetical protein
MTDIRFVRKDGQSVAIAIVRTRFFESVDDAKINLLYASRMSHDAMHGDAEARELVEQLCGVEIVDSDVGFGF